MYDCRTIDIENALQAALNALGIKASAPPVPADLMPCVYVYRTGGFSQNYVQDAHSVDFDCYAENEAAAMARADQITEYVRALPEAQGLSAYVYATSITTLPYNNPDPNHYALARATVSAQIITRVTHEKEG